MSKRYTIARSNEAVDAVLNKCDDQEQEGSSQYPGMTYEQGVQDGIRWLIGDSNSNPVED